MLQKQQEASAIDVAYEEEQQRRLEAVQAEREADAMAQVAVLAGLQQAQQNVLGSETSPAGSTAEVDDSPSTSVEQINTASSSKQPSSVSGTSGAAAGADAAAQGQSDAAASGFAPDNTDSEAEADAKNYPPLVFEPGSLDRVRKGKDGTETAPQVLQVRDAASQGMQLFAGLLACISALYLQSQKRQGAVVWCLFFLLQLQHICI